MSNNVKLFTSTSSLCGFSLFCNIEKEPCIFHFTETCNTKTDEMYLVNLLTSSFDFFVYFGNSPNWRKVSSTGHEVTEMLCLNKFGMEGVQKVRELEQLVVADAKNANYLLVIKKQLQDEDISKEERTAALHSLRRIFIHFLESGRLESNFVSAHSNQLAVSGESGQSGKLQEYQKWLIQQFNSYQATLLKLISSNETYLQAPAIRTILEVSLYCNFMEPTRIWEEIIMYHNYLS